MLGPKGAASETEIVVTAKAPQTSAPAADPVADPALNNTANGQPALPTPKGYLNGSKMVINGSPINYANLSAAQKTIANNIMVNGDPTGVLTEQLVDDIIENSSSYKLLSGGKYGGGSNNGFDQVVQSADGSVTIIMDSKQIDASGGVQMGSAFDGQNQLSSSWIDGVLDNLPENSPARLAIVQAKANGTLKTAVAGLDKSTGNIFITPVTVQ